MNERDKDITDIRKERDNLAALLRRFIHATRPREAVTLLHEPQSTVDDLREKAANYLKRKGLDGSPLK